MRLRVGITAVTGLVTAITCSGPGIAQSLDEAEQAAVFGSWTLRSSQTRVEGAAARLRGSLDAFMPTVALAGERPLHSKISYSPDVPVPTEPPDTTPRREPRRYGITIDLPLFDGFQRWNNLESSRRLLDAERNLAVDARQQVLLETATAYLSVLRDTRVIEFRRKQLASVQSVLATVRAKYNVKDATKTDVALASSRVDDAASALEQAIGDLKASQIEFVRLTNAPLDVHASAIRLPELPATEAELIDCVRQANPKLAAARLDAVSANYLHDAAKGALYPQLSLQAFYGRDEKISDTLNRVSDTTVKLQARIPIYQPGVISRIDEASAIARQKWYDLEDSSRRLLSGVSTTFQRIEATKRQVATLRSRVAQLRAAVTGYGIERSAGFRTVLDELNTRSELAQAEVFLVTLESEQDRLKFLLAAALNRLGNNPVVRPVIVPPVASLALPVPVAAMAPLAKPMQVVRAELPPVQPTPVRSAQSDRSEPALKLRR